MKKLMFAMAVMAAGAAMADVTSANVVGYQALNTDNEGGNVMLAPTFLKVSESNTVTLADLKVTGYDEPVWEKRDKDKNPRNYGGCTGGKFVTATLTPAGTEDKSYTWLDYFKGGNRIGPGWFMDGNATPIEGGAASVELDAGDSLWIKGSGYQLQPAGAVNPFDIIFKTDVDGGNKAVGNCTPVELTLADLTVTGYDDPVWEKRDKDKNPRNYGGCTGGKFVAATLTPAGTEDKSYTWLDYFKGGNRIGPGWFMDGNATPIEGGAEGVKIPAGKGLWVKGSGYNLVIPAPEL